MALIPPTSVLDVMRATFPNGYVDHAGYSARLAALKAGRSYAVELVSDFSKPPCSAVDLFALMGNLLLKSGAYHHVGPLVPGTPPGTMLVVTDQMRAGWTADGKAWRGDGSRTLPAPPRRVATLWNKLVAHQNAPIFTGAGASTRGWWASAIALFCIADEAALDIGFYGETKSAQAEYIEAPIRERQARSTTGAPQRGPYTLSRANPDQLCVLPKSRTAKVGCTIRSLSHNLALLPARGSARAHWSLTPKRQPPMPAGDPVPFNVVVLPIPFAIRAEAFKGMPSESGNWGWFDVEPHWCPRSGGSTAGIDMFLDFVEQVIEGASDDAGAVHALVMPEVALSHEVFRVLCERLKRRTDFELLVAGLFDAPGPSGSGIRRGNFTGMARFTNAGGLADFDVSIREKHHRWRLDAEQIGNYALGSALNVNRGWWEHIDILGRSLDVFVLRGGASVTTLICEDLARNDPCQELVRGIGPNLVVALLMDGPQLRDRWPARYATVLAEDPGSSVLSVTSFGLIDRGNKTGKYPAADQIGLFRDDTGVTTEIKLPKGAQAVRLTLQPTKLTEHTLDGRADKGDAQSWRLSGIQPVQIDQPDRDIMKGTWPTPRP